MELEIASLPESQLADYSAVPIGFTVTQRVTLAGDERGLHALRVVPIPVAYEKDYDALPGMSPMSWASRYRLREWEIVVARRGIEILGGAAFAPAAQVGMDLEGRRDTVVLWDLRVAPGARGQQIGSALFRAGERWAARGGNTALLAETQDTNVAACRFYQSMGCTLVEYAPDAYPDFPDEARLLWRRDLGVDRLPG